MPDSYYRRVVRESLGATLGPLDSYGTGIIFTPKEERAVDAIKELFAMQAAQKGLKVIGWRSVKTGNSYLHLKYLISL